MRLAKWLTALSLCLCTLLVAGCSSEAATPEDDAFMKQLAEADAKNQGTPQKKSGGVPLPPTQGGTAGAPSGDDKAPDGAK